MFHWTVWSPHRVTCVYLACKVEEFNISIQQFVANIKGDREKASDIILNDELLLMQQLNFHLTIHNPYRPVTGLLIDIKVRLLVQQGNCRSVRERNNAKNQNFYRVIILFDTCHLSLPISTALCISGKWASLTLRLLMSYIYGAPSKARNANVYIWTHVWQR